MRDTVDRAAFVMRIVRIDAPAQLSQIAVAVPSSARNDRRRLTRKAHPLRGGAAKPTGLLFRTTAGLPNQLLGWSAWRMPPQLRNQDPELSFMETTVMTTRTTSTSSGRISPARATMLGASTVLAMLGAAGAAQAKDAVATAIWNVEGTGSPPDAIVTYNGQGLTPGTYAIGTIMVDYFVTGWQFPADWERRFKICLDTQAIGKGAATNYPANVYVKQVGNSGLDIGGVVATVGFDSAADDPAPADDTKCFDVTASVGSSAPVDPEDGQSLVANLQEETDVGEHLDTPTTVKVRLTILHPTACVRALHLVSNQDFTIDVGATGIAESVNKSNKKLASHPVDLQHLLVLVNACSTTQTVDVNTRINPNFEVFAHNGIRTSSLGQEFADADELLGYGLDWNDLDNLNPAELCLVNVEIPAGESFLFTRRVRVKEMGDFPGTYASSLGRELLDDQDAPVWFYDGFEFAMQAAVGACPDFGTAETTGELAVPVNEVKLTGNGGYTQMAP